MAGRDAEKREDPVVFLIRRDSKCEVCGDDLPSGSMQAKQGEKGLCLPCAALAAQPPRGRDGGARRAAAQADSADTRA